MSFLPLRTPSEAHPPIPRARGACRPAASPRPERSTQYLRQPTTADVACRRCPLLQRNLSQPEHSLRRSSNLSFSLTSSVSDLIGRFGTILLGPNHTVAD